MSVLKQEDDEDLAAMYAVIAHLGAESADPDIEEWDGGG
jgi:hypothetical protein